jgi:Zn-finger nucleic acid-binding protein
MNCPRCTGLSLQEIDRDGITLDRCEICRGIWLDRGELEKLLARGREKSASRSRDDEHDAAANMDQRPIRRGGDDDDDDDERGHRGSARRRSWWEIFD